MEGDKTLSTIAFIITSCLFALLIFFSFPQNTPSETLITQETSNENVRRVDFIGESGSIITHPAYGYATMIQHLNSEGAPIEEYYYDEVGNPVASSGGYYGVQRFYENGLCVRYTYVGSDNQPIKSSSGYATVEQEYNEKKQIEAVYYLDTDYMPVASSMGQYGELRVYDSKGRNYKATFIDKNGNPIENSAGYCYVTRDYLCDGNVDIEWYYNLKGEKVDIGHGRYGSQIVYENGVYKGWMPVDTNGNVVVHLDTLLFNNPWIIGVVAIALIFLLLFLPKKLRLFLLIAYVLFILCITLIFRETGDAAGYNLDLLWSYKQLFSDHSIGVQVLLNIWLFIPLGAALASVRRSPRLIILAILFSILIEASQYFFGLGLCELDDVISNSLGAWLGWGCFCKIERWKQEKINKEKIDST